MAPRSRSLQNVRNIQSAHLLVQGNIQSAHLLVQGNIQSAHLLVQGTCAALKGVLWDQGARGPDPVTLLHSTRLFQ